MLYCYKSLKLKENMTKFNANPEVFSWLRGWLAQFLFLKIHYAGKVERTYVDKLTDFIIV